MAFQRDSRCSPKNHFHPSSMSHLCLMYVSCMSNLCQMYPLAAPLLVPFRAPKSPCARRFHVLVPSTVSTKQEFARFDAVARRFACFDVFHGQKTGSHGENMWKHGFYRDLGGIMFLRFAVALAGPAASRRRIPAEPLN